MGRGCPPPKYIKIYKYDNYGEIRKTCEKISKVTGRTLFNIFQTFDVLYVIMGVVSSRGTRSLPPQSTSKKKDMHRKVCAPTNID